ncbi:MAG: hypothetical protein QGH94_13185 [Phycisphaerae bacterium]|jgi:hypothetical protein|nr:hypothetical protein [Phycisphaerae bacterium]
MEQIHSQSGRSEFAVAFGSIRAAKNLAAGLIILALLLQIGGMAAVHFARLLDEPAGSVVAVPKGDAAAPAAKGDEAAPAAATKPAGDAAAASAAKPKSEKEYDVAGIARVVLQYGLPASRFAVLALGLLLVLMIMFAVKLSLIERVGGVGGFISSFNWSLILLMMLIPWRQILNSSISCGALFNYTELMNADAALGQTPATFDQAYFYARYLAYPCVALLTCLIVQAKFAKGYSEVKFQVAEADAIAARISR